jgi:hypothetical protein
MVSVEETPMQSYTIPRGHNSYCGPSALAYLTRTDPDYAAAQFRKWSHKRSIKGVSNSLMLFTLRMLGFKPFEAVPRSLRPIDNTRWPSVRYPTFKQWWLSTEEEAVYLVNITGHYIVLDGLRVYDNRFREGQAFHVCPYLNRRVKAAWRIEK